MYTSSYNQGIAINSFFLVTPLLIWGLFGHNPLEVVVALLTIPLFTKLFLEKMGFAVIFLGLCMQWLSISIKLIYGIFINLPLPEVIPNDSIPDKVTTAFYLSLIGLIITALGIYLATGRARQVNFIHNLEKELLTYDAKKIVIAAILAHLLYTTLYVIRFAIPGINSIATVIFQLKWGVFLVAFYIVHKQNSSKILFYVFAFFLFVTGFGFFSNFKEVLFFMFIGFLSLKPKLEKKHYLLASIALLLIFRLGIVWTAVKGDYRMYLSGGARTIQNIRTTSESLSYLWNHYQDISREETDQALEALIDRIGYIDYFSLTLNHVPEIIPHENGEIWKNAVLHIFKPRIIFTNKPIIDDSEHTSKYTGRQFSGIGTASFSLGYTADAYIDFGPFLMFLPLFLLGWLIGKFYQNLLMNSLNYVWGVILTAPFFFFTNIYGMNTIKVFGLLFAYVILIILIRKPLIKIIDPMLRKPNFNLIN